jgi:hypothetical protein
VQPYLSACVLRVWSTWTVVDDKGEGQRIRGDGPGAAKDECWDLTEGPEKAR